MSEPIKNMGPAQNRDKDIRMIEIEVEKNTSLEEIEEEINEKLRSRHVKEFLCNPGDEVVIYLRSEGP
jgi:hypothetical protein